VDNKKISFVSPAGKTIDCIESRGVNEHGSAVLIHGLGGSIEQEHLMEAARVLKEHGFRVLLVSASEDIAYGKEAVKKATATARIENLKDALIYIEESGWNMAELIVGGHSLGGLAAGVIASRDKRVKGALLLAPVVSGDMALMRRGVEALHAWREKGSVEREFQTHPNEVFEIRYEFMDDMRHYSLLQCADDIAAYVLMVVGSQDESTPASELKLLAHVLNDRGTYVEIEGTRHNFRGKEKEVGSAIAAWLAKEF
jgi:pimeloyl-ACP methyl ester carboxylesterase